MHFYNNKPVICYDFFVQVTYQCSKSVKMNDFLGWFMIENELMVNTFLSRVFFYTDHLSMFLSMWYIHQCGKGVDIK